MWKLLDQYVPDFQEPAKQMNLNLPKLTKVEDQGTVGASEIKLPKLMKIEK